MPKLLKHIDAIAREKNRDVLFLHFENYQEYDDGGDPIRSIDTYAGDVFIDLAMDENDQRYRELSEYLEDDEGNMMLDGVLFFVLSLEIALEVEADRKESEQANSSLVELDLSESSILSDKPRNLS